MAPNPPKTSVLLQRISTATSATRKQSQRRSSPIISCAAAASEVPETVARYHAHPVGPNQCCSAVIQRISAPVSTVWSVVRRFDNPQAYKHFVKSCDVIVGDGDVGTLREVRVISGLPAGSSTERLEILDEERHVISFSVVDGDHRLANYRSVTTLHAEPGGTTTVVESYVVDVPPGNTRDETCVFVDTIVKSPPVKKDRNPVDGASCSSRNRSSGTRKAAWVQIIATPTINAETRTDPTLVRKTTTTVEMSRAPRREAENYGNQGKVVDLEVGVVFADAESGIGDGIRLREGGAVHELRPGTAVGEAVAYGIGDVVYEGTESRGGCYDDGVGGGHGGAGGGLSIRDGENCRR
nr:abscisic acid receptor PYL4-like [Ipomoea batatas]